MRRMMPRLLGGLAVILHVSALVYFVLWLDKTDFMFGHFKGPPERILAALGLSSLGAVATMVWLATLVLLSRGPRPAGPRFRLLPVLGSLVLLMFSAPALIIVPVGILEWSDARATMRRQAVKWNPTTPKDFAGLSKALGDEDAYVRAEAARSLSQAKTLPADSIPHLIQLAARGEEGASFHAIRALGALGPEAQEAIPTLKELLGASEFLGPVAGEALAQIGPAARPALMAGTVSDDLQIRVSCARALGFYKPADSEMIARLATMLGDADPEVCRAAAVSLGMVGANAQVALPELDAAMTHPDPGVRAAAERSILKIAEGTSDKLRQGKMELRSRYNTNRANAAAMLGAMGEEARAALPELIVAMEDPEWEVQLAAARAVWKVSGDADLVVPKLIKLLQIETEHNLPRSRTLDLLMAIGPPASAAVPALEALSTSSNPGIRLKANAAIIYITDPPEYRKVKP